MGQLPKTEFDKLQEQEKATPLFKEKYEFNIDNLKAMAKPSQEFQAAYEKEVSDLLAKKHAELIKQHKKASLHGVNYELINDEYERDTMLAHFSATTNNDGVNIQSIPKPKKPMPVTEKPPRGSTDKFITIEQFNSTMSALEQGINNFVQKGNGEMGELKKEFTKLTESMTSVLNKNAEGFADLVKEVSKIRESQQASVPVNITLAKPQGVEEIVVTNQHKNFKKLLTAISNQHHVFLHGPTGTGKTTAVRNATKAMGIKCYSLTVNRETSMYSFMGHLSKGEYHPGVAYYPYKEGGVLLVDELDNGNANGNTAIKTLTDNETAFFPCGLVERHPEFRVIACANTTGTGANQKYVGRNQQDKALLNIFKFIDWEIDDPFEEAIAWAEYLTWGGSKDNRKQFDSLLKEIRLIRDAIDHFNFNHIISPRNTKYFFRDFARGTPLPEIIDSVLVRELPKDKASKVFEHVKGLKKPKGEILPSDQISKLWTPK